MSPRPIPSPCGIPLIFSSVQIRLYRSPIALYCYRSLLESNWIMFNLKLFSHTGSGRWLVILWQEQEKKLFLWTGDEAETLLLSDSDAVWFQCINIHQHQWHHSILCEVSPVPPDRAASLCSVSVGPPPSPLRAEMFCWLINSREASDQWLWWADRPRAGYWTRPDLCLCRSLVFVIAA